MKNKSVEPELLKTAYNLIQEQDIQNKSIADQLSYLAENFENMVFSSSFSYEDQMITHLLRDIDVRIFTLDTGRLFPETYETWNLTLSKYRRNIETYYPDTDRLQKFITQNGPDAFYKSVENRKSCCYIRKVEPLNRALSGQQVWITGLRSEHSPQRQHLNTFEWDEQLKIIKYHPLLHLKTADVINYIKENKIPYNRLHDKGYISIGCAPCTRALREGENFRAGRWWWEDGSKKECGLHLKQ